MTPTQFRKIRQSANMTVKAMAGYLGVTTRAIHYYESGNRAIPEMAVRLLAMMENKHD